MEMRNKVVVVTGAGKGLGKELSEILALEGSKVVICSRSKNDLSNVCRGIVNKGGSCEYFVVDVTNKEKVEAFIDSTIKKYKRIDVLINNAGYVQDWETIENTAEDELKNCFETNLYSIFYFIKKIIPVMKKQDEGAIINISSMAGKRGVPNLAVYSASKFAVMGLTQAIAKEIENANIYCISVCPGGMNTGMREKVLGSEDAKKQQDPRFVANVVKDVLLGKVKVPHGGDITIRYGKITSINEAPE